MQIRTLVRYAMWAVGGVLFLAAALIAWIVFMFDANSLKPQIEQRVRETTGRQLQLQGQLQLRLWPRIGATVDKARWSEYQSAQTFVELGHIQVDLAFWPILQQRYVVEQLDIDGLRGTLIRHADGRLSIDDLLKREPEAQKAPSGPVEFAIDRVRVRNAAFTFDDRQAGRRSSIEQLQLSADAISPRGADAISLAARISNSQPAVAVQLQVTAAQLRHGEGQPVQLSGLNVRLAGQLPESITLQQLQLSSARVSYVPQGPLQVDTLQLGITGSAPQGKLNNVQLKLAGAEVNGDYSQASIKGLHLTGQASAKAGELRKLDLKLASASWAREGASTLDQLQLQAEGDTPQLRQVAVNLSTGRGSVQADQSVRVEQLRLQARGQQQGRQLNVTASSPALVWQATQLQLAQLQLDGQVRSAQENASFKAQLSGVRSDLKTSLAIEQLRADVQAASGKQQVQLNATSPVQLALSPMQVELPALAVSGKLLTPSLKAGNASFRLSGPLRVNVAQEQVNTRLTGQLDRSQGHVQVAVNGFAKPAISFDIGLDQIDLGHYLASDPAGAGTPAPAQPAAAPAPIDLSPLAPLQLDGKLAVGRLVKDKIDASKLALTLKAGGGVFAVPQLSVQAFGGSMNGSLSATTTRNPTFNIRQQLTGVNIQHVLSTFADFSKLHGTGNITADLKASGGTLDQLQQTVGGQVQLRLSDGAWEGINIGKLLRDSRAMLQGGQQTRNSVNTEKTDFTELTASIALDKGIARNEDLSLKSPLVRVSGKGEASLPAQTLDYRVQVSVVGTSQGQGGRELEQLRGVTVPLRIHGPFASPRYSIDFASMLKQATRAELEAQKQQLEAEARQKLQAADEQARQKLQEEQARAQEKLKQEQQKAKDKLQNELNKGLNRLFGGRSKPAPAASAGGAQPASAGKAAPAR